MPHTTHADDAEGKDILEKIRMLAAEFVVAQATFSAVEESLRKKAMLCTKNEEIKNEEIEAIVRSYGHTSFELLDAKGRKEVPIATGVIDYFPDALAAVAHCSFVGNKQHSPGQPMQWDRSKSTDEADALMRHFLQRGTRDLDGVRHSAKVAWRALALLQKEIENED